MAGLALDGVSRAFGGLKAVADLTLAAEPGRITGLIGPNGAGKTTVVNLVTGLLALSAGRVLIDDVDVSREPPHAIARRGVARTFQNIRLLAESSVIDNVMIGFHAHERSGLLASLLGLPSVGAERRALRIEAAALVQRFGMGAYAERPAGSLSYGHQRRVEMMRALAARPRILLLDEPVAGMNDVEADELGRIFRSLADEGLAILLIEHNMRFVMSLCDVVHVLDSGALIASGPPRVVAREPRVVEAYLGA